MSTVVSGRWRPVQGSIQALAVFIGALGLVSGPQAGEPIAMVSGDQPLFYMLFYVSLLVGGLIAMTGEIMQLRQPIVGVTPKQVADLATGMLVEMAGTLMITANLSAFVIAILIAPEISDYRAVTLLFVAVGLFGRTCQTAFDIRRIRKSLEKRAG